MGMQQGMRNQGGNMNWQQQNQPYNKMQNQGYGNNMGGGYNQGGQYRRWLSQFWVWVMNSPTVYPQYCDALFKLYRDIS